MMMMMMMARVLMSRMSFHLSPQKDKQFSFGLIRNGERRQAEEGTSLCFLSGQPPGKACLSGSAQPVSAPAGLLVPPPKVTEAVAALDLGCAASGKRNNEPAQREGDRGRGRGTEAEQPLGPGLQRMEEVHWPGLLTPDLEEGGAT